MTCEKCGADIKKKWKVVTLFCRQCNQSIKRRKRKKILVDLLGGSCIICGYNKCLEALQFHHREESHKTISISKNLSGSFKNLKKEIQKCILVCANCHAEIESLKRKREYED